LKLFLRILRFAQPYTFNALIFTLIAFISTIFSIVNFALLIYLLDLLFNNLTEAKLQSMLVQPIFDWKFDYLLKLCNYYFAYTIQHHGKFAAIQLVCLQVFLATFLSNLGLYLSVVIRERIKNRVIRNARNAIFNKMMDLHLGYFSNQRKGDLMNRSMGDTGELESMVNNSLNLFLREPLSVVVYLISLLAISWQLTIFTFIVVPLMGAGISYITSSLRRKSSRLLHLGGLMTSSIEEVLGALRVVKSYNADNYIIKKFDDNNKNFIDHARKINLMSELASPFSELAGVTLVICVVLYGGNLMLNGQSTLSPSQFTIYLMLLAKLLQPIKAIISSVASLQRGLASGKRVFEVLDTQNEVIDKPNAKVLHTFENSIEFRNVSFKYEQDWILKNVSFLIKKGSTVALVGASGSGKSTIADLLCRFYDIQEGEILVDGIDIRDITQKSLREQMGIVTQEYILFNDSIFNNIAFAQNNATQTQVEQAARIANAHDFITNTSEGYQTNAGDRGTKLSGGQKQRISIARAVFKNPPIMILDEATSSLDTESEKIVQTALNNLMENRTSLIIAHRLSTIQHADQIIVLQKGEIVERGTHEQLIQIEGGAYQNLNNMQALTSVG